MPTRLPSVNDRRCGSDATVQSDGEEIPPQFSPIKGLNNSHLLEYTQPNNQSGRQLFGVVFEKKRFRPTTLWLKETPRQRSVEQREWMSSIHSRGETRCQT